MNKKHRKIGSIKNELIQKSKEAMLAAVQIFNNPNIQFKSESFIVLANIAWTYLPIASACNPATNAGRKPRNDGENGRFLKNCRVQSQYLR